MPSCVLADSSCCKSLCAAAPRGGRTGGPGGNGSRYDDDYLPGMPGSGTGSGANQGKFEVDFRSLAQDRF